VADKELLWQQYELHIGLYKEYLNLALKMNAFYYVATGAFISFYFSKPNVPWMKYSLLFPSLMSLGLSVFFLYGAQQAKYSRQDVFSLRDQLGLRVAPEYAVLIVFLWMSAILLILVVIGLLFIIFGPLPG
jgi:hypothetical protein